MILCSYRKNESNRNTTWMGKRVPISVSVYSNLQEDTPSFLGEKDPELLINAFVSMLEFLAQKSTLQMRNNFLEIKITVI